MLVTLRTPQGSPLFSILKAETEEAPMATGFPERTYIQWMLTACIEHRLGSRQLERPGPVRPPEHEDGPSLSLAVTLEIWTQQRMPFKGISVLRLS